MSYKSDCHEKQVPVPGKGHECESCELSCLERPKYFCGQLLTDDVLNAEQKYQREKNKLHNRYLHGWGVVCGLEVTCYSKCGTKGEVLVKQGYAIDCCGNDIIVCKDEVVDVVDLIDECKPKPEDDDCENKKRPRDECSGEEKKYCLYLKYKEEESRPVTALKKDIDGSCVKRCEPSRIKEGYTFEVKECTECESDDKNAFSKYLLEDTALEGILKCFHSLQKHFINLNNYSNGANHESSFKAYQEIKGFIQEASKKGSVRCEDIDFLPFPAPPVPGPSGDNTTYNASLKRVFTQLESLLKQIFNDCLCHHALYPCPECDEDDNVILACFTVQRGAIKHICNASRRQVMSFPKLFYWFPINKVYRQKFIEDCCKQPAPDNVGVRSGVGNMNQLSLMTNPLFAMQTVTKAMLNSLVSNKNEGNARRNLSNSGFTVGDVVREDELAPGAENLESALFKTSTAPTVDLIVSDTDDNKVIGVKLREESESEVKFLKAKLAALELILKPDMTSVINAYNKKEHPLQTTAIAKGLVEEMPTEDLAVIGEVRDKNLSDVGINNVLKLAESNAKAISKATKDINHDDAIKYIDLAEKMTLKVATIVGDVLESKKIKNKKGVKGKEATELVNDLAESMTKIFENEKIKISAKKAVTIIGAILKKDGIIK